MDSAARHARLVALIVVAGAVPAAAHDYWLELSTFRPVPETRVTVAHRVGEHLAGEPVPRNPFALVRFEVATAVGVSAIPGVDGADPAGWFTANAAGPHEVIYQGRSSYVELEAQKFHDYLVQEGLESTLAERERRGESTALAREAFRRSAKAIACTAPADGPKASRTRPPEARGLELEIVPDYDLCRLEAGASIGFRLLRDGRPAAGVLMMALDRTAPNAPLQVRTDGAGRFRFTLPRTGFWLIRGVSMERLQGDPKADWQSRWASLTFELAAGTP